MILYIISYALIFLTFSCSEKTTIEDSEDHTEAIGMVVYHNGSPYFKIREAKIDSTISNEFALKLNQALEFEVKFIGEGGEEIVPHENEKSLSWIIDDTTLVEMELLPNEKWKFRAIGKKVGSTLIEFRLNHGDHPDFKTPKVPLIVTE